MTKAEIIKELALRSGIHPRLAEHPYDNLSDILAEGRCRDHCVPK
ncbi:hypothetical protein [Acidithiobacillus sp. AMEEHan]|nr:hypothetical protein [Acidithiobacillus sp. AMEEHan]